MADLKLGINLWSQAGGWDPFLAAGRRAESLGFDHPRWTRRLVTFGKVFAVIIAGGFIVIAAWAHFAGAGQ